MGTSFSRLPQSWGDVICVLLCLGQPDRRILSILLGSMMVKRELWLQTGLLGPFGGREAESEWQ